MVTDVQYQQQLLKLLADAPADLVFVGGSDVLQQMQISDPPVHTFPDVAQCLNSSLTSQNSQRVLVSIQPTDIELLRQQIGQLCQRFAHQVLIELRHKPGDNSAALAFQRACFASGFRQAMHLVSDDMEYQLYEYRLKNYKQAPDWLNSRFWAHPERFNTRD